MTCRLYVLPVAVFLTVACGTPTTARAKTFPFDTEFTVYSRSLNAEFNLWLPDDTPYVRGLVLMISGSDGDWRYQADDATWQHAAETMGFGLVGVSNQHASLSYPAWNGIGRAVWGELGTGEIAENLQAMLDAAAEVSGHREISNVPVAPIGHSNGAVNTVLLAAEVPSRTVAYAALRAGFTPDVFLNQTRNVPGIALGGSLDTSGPSPTIIQETFLDVRSQGAQVAFVLDWGAQHNLSGHADRPRALGRTWETGWYWLAEAVRLRYPEGVLPSLVPGNPLVLDDIPTEAGWLGEAATFEAGRSGDRPVNVSTFPEIAPAETYEGDPAIASWLPSDGAANVYRAATAIGNGRLISDMEGRYLGGPMEFMSPTSFVDRTPEFYVAGEKIRLLVEPHEFDDVDPIVQMEFFDGADLIGVDTVGPEWSIDYWPGQAGIHGLVAIATDASGNKTSAFRAAIVGAVPEPRCLALISIALGILSICGSRRDTRTMPAHSIH